MNQTDIECLARVVAELVLRAEHHDIHRLGVTADMAYEINPYTSDASSAFIALVGENYKRLKPGYDSLYSGKEDGWSAWVRD